MVAGLEQQYDAFTRGDDDGGLPLAEERDLPTAEELGARVRAVPRRARPDDG